MKTLFTQHTEHFNNIHVHISYSLFMRESFVSYFSTLEEVYLSLKVIYVIIPELFSDFISEGINFETIDLFLLPKGLILEYLSHGSVTTVCRVSHLGCSFYSYSRVV